MRYFRPVEFSIKTLSPEKAKAGCVVVGVHARQRAHRPRRKRVDQAAQGRAAQGARATSPARPARRCCCAACRASPPSACCWSAWASASEFGESGVPRRGARRRRRAEGARREGRGAVPGRHEGRRAARLRWNVRHAVLGVREAFYRFDQLKIAEEGAARPRSQHVVLPLAARKPSCKQALAEAAATADGVDLAKHARQPAAQHLHARLPRRRGARSSRAQFKLGVEVLERKDMEKLGMGALLAVARASHQPPKLIVLHYNGAREEQEAGGAGRQGHHLRHRRHLAQARGRDGRDEVRHVGRRQRARRDARAGRHEGAGQRGRRDPDLREHARRPRHAARRHRHHAVRARRSRSSTPTPRAA